MLTSTTGGPSSAATFATAASTWSAWLTSAPTASARPPAEVIASTVRAAVAFLQVEHGDREPVGGKAPGSGRADAPRATGDDGDPLCFVWHVFLLLSNVRLRSAAVAYLSSG